MSTEDDELFWHDSTTPSPIADVVERSLNSSPGVMAQFDWARRRLKRSWPPDGNTYDASELGLESRQRHGGMRGGKATKLVSPSYDGL